MRVIYHASKDDINSMGVGVGGGRGLGVGIGGDRSRTRTLSSSSSPGLTLAERTPTRARSETGYFTTPTLWSSTTDIGGSGGLLNDGLSGGSGLLGSGSSRGGGGGGGKMARMLRRVSNALSLTSDSYSRSESHRGLVDPNTGSDITRHDHNRNDRREKNEEKEEKEEKSHQTVVAGLLTISHMQANNLVMIAGWGTRKVPPL